jgi:hypothetical protein
MMISICEAIAKQEGFGVPGGRAMRNNNPGDIEFGIFARQFGADRIETLPPPRTPRFAHFPTVEQGYAAMRELLTRHYTAMSIAQMIYKYAPPSENNTEQYITDVCAWTGLERNTLIDKFL